MKKFIVLITAFLIANSAVADDGQGNLRASADDRSKNYCHFDGKRYSSGAQLMIGGQYIACVINDTDRPNWSAIGIKHCFYAGQLYSHTAVIKNPEGGVKYCHTGDWRKGNP